MGIIKSIRERIKKGWPTITIDLSQRSQRIKLIVGGLGILVVTLALLAGGIQGYVYSESSEFCGTVCHSMDPQYAQFEASAHANVECVKCHIGPGFVPFVEAKIAGMRQVYGTLTNNFHRPIKSPIHNLRPARETCETCHTPTSFRDNVIKTVSHYDNDEANTEINTTLILKMGGWEESTGVNEGIHWHIKSSVYYIAADEQRQVISWVGVEQADGSLKEYFSRDMLNMDREKYVEKARAEDHVRKLDCIDCHNRTSHYIPSPEEAVDKAITSGKISKDIPFIRAKAVEILDVSYKSQSEADASIDKLAEYYKSHFPKSSPAKLDSAVAEIKSIYARIYYPEMNLTWETNPNNLGHAAFIGCFRCHDDKHVNVDESGKETSTIGVKCNLCHTVPITSRGSELSVEAPVITGAVPESHSDFRWTIEHRTTTEEATQDCYQCHGQAFCNNGACHNLSHPEDMLFTHPEEYKKSGGQVCYTCHQDVLCSRCHPGGIVSNP